MVRLFLILFLLTLFLSAAITPAICELYFALCDNCTSLTWPFSRIYDRVAMFIAAILLWRYRKDFNLAVLVPLFEAKPKLKSFLIGLAISIFASVLIIPVVIDGETFLFSIKSFDYYLYRVAKYLIAAVVISIIEESFFRGLMFSSLRTRFNFWLAAVITSLFYASVHFIAPVKSWSYPKGDLLAGVNYLFVIFSEMFQYAYLKPYLALFLVGMVLCFLMYRTGSIWLCMGIHTGWVLVMKLTKSFSYLNPELNLALPKLAERYMLITTPFAWAAILLVGVLGYFFVRTKHESKA